MINWFRNRKKPILIEPEPIVTPTPELDINFDIIRQWEGGMQLKGYVPKRNGVAIGASGVTIASGVDLGQQNFETLKTDWELDEELISKLSPYLTWKKQTAIEFLEKHPLSITEEQATSLDVSVKKYFARTLSNKFFSQTSIEFETLPEPMQTVLLSMAWNLGFDLDFGRNNRVWKILRSRDWIKLYGLLNRFGHGVKGLQNRRLNEADYMAKAFTLKA